MEKFKQGFFEFISAASNEKVHSQTLAWIFSTNCTAFTPEVKGEILCQFVGDTMDNSKNYIPLKSIAEIEDIDLFIECANVCLIIENKIKSSQHSNQLYKYQYFTTIDEVQKISILDEWVKNAFPHFTCLELNDKKNKLRDKYSLQKYPAFEQLLKSKAPKYLYLNLIKEPVEYNWMNITYETVFNIFENYYANKLSIEANTGDSHILKDYLACIGRLQQSVNYFKDKKNQTIREHVIMTGKASKITLLEKELNSYNQVTEKNEENIENFIKKNQLETILQKQFYLEILQNIPSLEFSAMTTNVAESHGSALLNFNFDGIDFENDGNTCTGILQFQGSSIKLAIAVDKETPRTNWKEILIPAFVGQLTKFVEKTNNQAFCNVTIPIKVSNGNLNDEKQHGFCSTKLTYNNSDKFWQLSANPTEIVKNCRNFAYDFFNQFIFS